MTDLIVNADAISAAATQLSNIRSTVRFEPFPPSIDGCGSAQVSSAFHQTLATMNRQDSSIRESWAAVGDQLTATLAAYSAADQSLANQES